MPYEPGLEEDGFLRMLRVKPHNLELLADKCTKVRLEWLKDKIIHKNAILFQIYVWHTRSQAPSFKWFEKISNQTLEETNLGALRKYWNEYN